MAVKLVTLAELGNQGIDYLVGNGTVVPVDQTNLPYRNTIFPASTKVHPQYVLDHYITSMPNAVFGDIDLMEQQTVIRYEEGPFDNVTQTPRLYGTQYKAKVHGSVADSIKRYQDLSKPLAPSVQGAESYIQAVVAWARSKGVQHIYCITEHRPNALSNNYVLNAVYYTVTGA